MEPLLRVHNLSVSLKKTGRALVSGVDFDIRKGEVFGVAGGSGSGKTLLCRALLHLTDPCLFTVEGAVWFHNRNIIQAPGKILTGIRGRKIAFIMQNPMSAFDPVMRIGRQMTETLMLHQRKSKAEILYGIQRECAAFGLHDMHRILRRFPSELSGGMLQRLMIILTMMLSPEIVIADEATTALDVKTQAEVLAAFSAMKAAGVSFIFVSHDLSVLKRIADRILVLHDGIAVETGTADEVYNSPRHDYTKELLAASRLDRDGCL